MFVEEAKAGEAEAPEDAEPQAHLHLAAEAPEDEVIFGDEVEAGEDDTNTMEAQLDEIEGELEGLDGSLAEAVSKAEGSPGNDDGTGVFPAAIAPAIISGELDTNTVEAQLNA